MQEFSSFEQLIIKEKLLEGATLREMFSKNFTQYARLKIQIDTSEERHIFQFYSDAYQATQAVEELVNLVDLISTLEEQGLVRKYFKAATNLSDFDHDETIEIGNSKSEKSAKFILPSGATEGIVLYLYKNLDKTFKATQKLRSIVANNFESLEERHHKQLVGLTRTANLISFLSAGAALAALIISLAPSSDREIINAKVDVIERRLNTLNGKAIKDSTDNLVIHNELKGLKIMLDSTKREASPQ